MVHSCPCCGYFVFVARGDYEICPICFWEDDFTQLQYPFSDAGANKVSLATAQINYIQFSASKLDMVMRVRSPSKDDVHDERWFPLWAKPIRWENKAEFDQDELSPIVSNESKLYWLE